MSTPDWQHFEQLVARLHRQLDPSATVQHNVRLNGKSGSKRQVDVLVEKQVGPYKQRLVIECKKLNRPVEIGEVDELIGKLIDLTLGPAQGVIVSASGFDAGALRRAAEAGIITMRIEDALQQNWDENLDRGFVRMVIFHPTTYETTLHTTQPYSEYVSRDDRPLFINSTGIEMNDHDIAMQEIHNVTLMPGKITHRMANADQYQLITTEGRVRMFAIDLTFIIEAFGFERILPATESISLINAQDSSDVHTHTTITLDLLEVFNPANLVSLGTAPAVLEFIQRPIPENVGTTMLSHGSLIIGDWSDLDQLRQH